MNNFKKGFFKQADSSTHANHKKLRGPYIMQMNEGISREVVYRSGVPLSEEDPPIVKFWGGKYLFALSKRKGTDEVVSEKINLDKLSSIVGLFCRTDLRDSFIDELEQELLTLKRESKSSAYLKWALTREITSFCFSMFLNSSMAKLLKYIFSK